jgi:hypothetical protein
MTGAYVFPLVMMLAFGGYYAWMMSKRSKALSDAGPALRDFFQRTGYRYADMPPEPLEPHIQRGTYEMQAGNAGTTHYVRNFHGLPIHFQQAYQATPNGYSISCSWWAELPRPPAVPFQVADRGLSSIGKAVYEAFSNMTRTWSPLHPVEVTTGMPPIDQRFRVFGRDAASVAAIFQRDAALVAALGQQVEVDLWIDDRRAVFSDPMQKNMNAGMGGTVGSMAIGFDMAKRFEISMAVHDRIAELLALAVRAAG